MPLLNPIDLGHGLLLLYALRLRRALLGAGTGEAPLAAWLHRSGPALAALTAGATSRGVPRAMIVSPAKAVQV